VKTALERAANFGPAAPAAPASVRKFAIALAVLTGLFAKVLFELTRFAVNSDTFSHIILIPPIAAYIASLRWKSITSQLERSTSLALIPAGIGGLLAIVGWLWTRSVEVQLCLFTLSFVLFVFAIALCFLGVAAVRQLAFPLTLLLFMVPLPPVVMGAVEVFFQHASAMAAAAMMKLSGLPVMQDGLFFYLPGFAVQVAQECSGIRSTLVLFITSLVTGYLLLRKPGNRAILVLSIIPLAILRNGFRIFCLAWLSVEVNPDILHSALHRQGGPIFFALSLIPLFMLLLLLRKLEKRRTDAS
jgi:exosortase C (VPDSG-CTERM-specific)